MEKRILTVKTIDVKDFETCKDIALQSLNIRRENGIYDIKFIDGMNRLKVKYFKNENNNIERVISHWGELINEEKEVFIELNIDDLKNSVAKEVDDIFMSDYDDDYSLDVSVQFVE